MQADAARLRSNSRSVRIGLPWLEATGSQPAVSGSIEVDHLGGQVITPYWRQASRCLW
jgi:hypothetical protein